MGKSFWQYQARPMNSTHIAVYTLICAATVFGADFTIICPLSLTDGLKYSVFCLVDKSTINVSGTGKCLAVDFVQFQLQHSGSWSTVDFSRYPACNTSFTGNARCVQNSSSVATYELLLTADNATHYGRALRCWSDCYESSLNILTTNYTTCNPIPITEPLTTTTPVQIATSAATATTTARGITTLKVGEIVAIVVCCFGAVVGGYMVYVGACWIISKKYRNQSQPDGHSPPAGQTPQGVHHPSGEHPPPSGPPPLAGLPPSGEHPGPGGPPPPAWHVHYLCGKKIEYVYFSCLRNGYTVLILSTSPKTHRFRFFGTEEGQFGSGVSPEPNQSSDSNNINTKASKKNKNAEHKGSDKSKAQ